MSQESDIRIDIWYKSHRYFYFICLLHLQTKTHAKLKHVQSHQTDLRVKIQWLWLARDMFHFAAEAQAISCEQREDLHEEMTKCSARNYLKKKKTKYSWLSCPS